MPARDIPSFPPSMHARQPRTGDNAHLGDSHCGLFPKTGRAVVAALVSTASVSERPWTDPARLSMRLGRSPSHSRIGRVQGRGTEHRVASSTMWISSSVRP